MINKKKKQWQKKKKKDKKILKHRMNMLECLINKNKIDSMNSKIEKRELKNL
jgi:hypothetical protein